MQQLQKSIMVAQKGFILIYLVKSKAKEKIQPHIPQLQH
jgi:hypothetical protein